MRFNQETQIRLQSVNTSEKNLFNAIGVGNIALVRDLVKNGLDTDSKNDQGQTALMKASELGYTNIVEFLIVNGANLESKGPFGTTALMYAAGFGRLSTVQMLIDNGADIKAYTDGEYPATAAFAANANNHDEIESLLSAQDN